VAGRQPLPKDTGWRLFARTMVARAYPRIIGQQRERVWMVFDITLPLAGLCAYVYVYRALQAPAEFVGFVILGGAMSAFWLNVLWAMANQLYNEKQFGNLPLYVMAPTSLMAICSPARCFFSAAQSFRSTCFQSGCGPSGSRSPLPTGSS
jgi:ABC-2 type transport system permease protein